jgi:hypothetical protein
VIGQLTHFSAAVAYAFVPGGVYLREVRTASVS